MHILGLNYLKRDPSAALISNGNIIAIVEEERFTRKKHSVGDFPYHSITECLQKANLKLPEIDAIAIGWDTPRYGPDLRSFFAKSWEEFGHLKNDENKKWEERLFKIYNQTTYTQSIQQRFSEYGFSANAIPPIVYYPHHYCHAVTAYYCSGFDNAAIITMDGHGEEHCTVLWHAQDTTIQKIHEVTIPHSLGWFYAAFTRLLGWEPYDGEGKVMGLAPYGCENLSLRQHINRMLCPTHDAYQSDPSFTAYGAHGAFKEMTSKFLDTFGPIRDEATPLTQHHKDIAFEAQYKLENIGLHLAQIAFAKTRSQNLCLAGGVALNCKMNGHIWKEGPFKNIFIQPISGDDGTAFGAAMCHHLRANTSHNFQMEHVYFGPSYTQEDIHKVIKKYTFSHNTYTDKDLSNIVAQYLFENKIVAWFQGNMEVGPRALGNRSILANPLKAHMKDHINNKVKFRESWRPFCPSIVYEKADTYLEKATESPFMILTFFIKKAMRPKLPAIVHVDGTARAQLVKKDINPKYYHLLKAFGEKSGHPVLLNTSFNIKGEPIVCSPEDALNCFQKTDLDILVLGNTVLTKKAS